MRRFATYVVIPSVTTVTAASITYSRHVAAGAPSPNSGAPMQADVFNALQDQAALQRALVSKAALASSGVTLLALSSCPYCMKIKTLLDVHRVPYETVAVDPFNAIELERSPYRFLPQLQFRAVTTTASLTPPSTARAAETNDASKGEKDGSKAADDGLSLMRRGPLIVDSDVIVQRLAAPLGYESDLVNPALRPVREKINTEVSRAVFVLMNGTLSSSWVSYPLLSDARYRHTLYRVVGSTALWLLATLKLRKRLGGLPADEALKAAMKPFIDGLGRNGGGGSVATTYFGGTRPNLVDIELYGALRSGLGHPNVQTALGEAGLSQWLAAMDAAVRSPSV